MMVTSWAQIMSLDPSYIGVYHCIATNNMGSLEAFADVGVYNNELYIYIFKFYSYLVIEIMAVTLKNE